jgi:hypothetical protein
MFNMSEIQAYKLIIEHKEHISPDKVRAWIETIITKAVDRFGGLAFNIFGECDYGKVIAAHMVIEHSEPVSAEKLQAILNVKHEGIMVQDVNKAE